MNHEEGVRIQPPAPTANRFVNRSCHYPSCAASTAAGKPYCTKHVTENPYASKLFAELCDLRSSVRKFRGSLAALTALVQWGSSEGLDLKQRRDARQLARLVDFNAASTVSGGPKAEAWVIRPTPFGEVIYWARCTKMRRPRRSN